MTGIARFEVRRKAERTIRANQQRREQGTPIVSTRILGYTQNGLEIVEDEAEAVRKAFHDFLSRSDHVEDRDRPNGCRVHNVTR